MCEKCTIKSGSKIRVVTPNGVVFHVTKKDLDVSGYFAGVDAETGKPADGVTGFGTKTLDGFQVIFAESQIGHTPVVEKVVERKAVTYRNNKTGEEVVSSMTPEEVCAAFARSFGGNKDGWLWFWLHKEVGRAAQTTSSTKTSIRFLCDQFTLAVGYGLKRPMIRLGYKNRRFKIYLSKRGTLCFKSGAVHPETRDPVGDEEYMGCVVKGRFLVSKDYYSGVERKLLAVEEEFLALLNENPVDFLARCGRDMCRCCFCNQPLEDERSKRVGYGATCAAHWGMPWGNKDYTEKTPSFAERYNDQVAGICSAVRDNPGDDLVWAVLGDWLEENSLPRCEKPKSGVILPRNDS